MMRKSILYILFGVFIVNGLIAASPITTGKITGNELQVTYQIPKDRHQVFQEEFNFFDFKIESVEGITLGETQYPEGKIGKDGHVEYYGETTLRKTIQIDPSAGLPDSLKVIAGYQFCLENGTCLIPEEEIIYIPMNEADISGVVSTASSQSTIGFLLLNLLFAFLGGMILNVMPCVFPVLSIKVMSIVGSAHENRKEILKGALIYTAGVLLSFLVFGGVIAGLKIAGQSVGWGFQFQNIGFVLFLLIVIWVFGLSLFDVFIIQLPGMQTATKASSKGGHWGSFFSGIFAVLLATPCTAPLLGAALGWAFAQPPFLIILSFLIIGLGLAFPFLILGFFPKLVRWIPKPGPWMETFKNIMAFLLMATAIYLIRVVYFLVDVKVIHVLWFLLFVAFSAWIYGHFGNLNRPKGKRIVASILALFIAVGAGFYFLRFESHMQISNDDVNQSGPVRDVHHPDWYVFQPELVEQFRAENKPVFIDFAAEWCITCKTNESTVLFTKDVKEAFAAKNVQLLRGDNTRENPLILEWLKKFNRAGVPLYIFYLPGEDEPVVLPEVITKDMIYKQLEKI